jgi:hydroxymethylbilane synthase
MSCPHHRPLRLGTRGSPLALAQAGQIARQLREQCGRPVTVVTLATPGDESAAPIERLGTTGVFTTTLRAALLGGAVDLVVHSCKDLPTAPVPGLRVAAFPAREDPRDALVWPGGTSLDALVLAMAGLSRLGLSDSPATPIDPSRLMPAPTQGVLAIECRIDDPVTAAQLSTLDHPPTRATAIAERAFLAAFAAGCSAPVGALAELTAEATGEPVMRLSGVIAAPDGSSVIRAQTAGAVGDGDALGRRLARTLLLQGGAELLARALNPHLLIATKNGGAW